MNVFYRRFPLFYLQKWYNLKFITLVKLQYNISENLKNDMSIIW